MKIVYKALICLLLIAGAWGCIPFVVCSGALSQNVLIITNKKNLDRDLLKKIFLLDEKGIEQFNFKSQKEFTDLMEKNGLVCEDNRCSLFFTNLPYSPKSLKKEYVFKISDLNNEYSYLSDISLEYNSFFDKLYIKKHYYFMIQYLNKSRYIEIHFSDPDLKDNSKKAVIHKKLPLKVNKNYFYNFYYSDPRTNCERPSRNSITSEYLNELLGKMKFILSN